MEQRKRSHHQGRTGTWTPFAIFCGARLLADKKTVVKTGETARMSDANTMRFVRERTSIPVPEVYNAYVDDKPGQVRVIMEFVEGTPLEEAWPEFFPEQKELIPASIGDTARRCGGRRETAKWMKDETRRLGESWFRT